MNLPEVPQELAKRHIDSEAALVDLTSVPCRGQGWAEAEEEAA